MPLAFPSRLGLGLAALGRPGYINLGHAEDLGYTYDVPAMEAHAHEVLDAAWDAGIRYFDAARSYGRAEDFLASWLRARAFRPEDVVVGSKWGYIYTAAWQTTAARHEVKDHSLTVFTTQLAETRARLGPHLDLYQIHSATPDSGVLDGAAVLGALARLRDAGVAIGLTLSGPRQGETLQRAIGITIGGAPLFACVQATWNLLERSAQPMLSAAHASGMRVIVKEALANGRLTSRNTAPEFAPKRRVLEMSAARLGTTVDALALAAALAQPWADVVLSGAATVEHLRANAAALRVPRSAGSTDVIEALAESPEEYWATRGRLAWN